MKITSKNYKYILADQFLPSYDKADGKPKNHGKMVNYLYTKVVPTLVAKTGAKKGRVIYVNTRIGYQIVLDLGYEDMEVDFEGAGFKRVYCNRDIAVEQPCDGSDQYFGYFCDKLVTDVCDTLEDCLQQLEKHRNKVFGLQ